MTNDDKALVERLRDDWPEILVEKHWMMDSDAIEEQRQEAADRIEAQAAEIERLREALRDVIDDLADGITIADEEGADASWLKGARKRLANARAALEETLHVAETCKENGETFT